MRVRHCGGSGCTATPVPMGSSVPGMTDPSGDHPDRGEGVDCTAESAVDGGRMARHFSGIWAGFGPWGRVSLGVAAVPGRPLAATAENGGGRSGRGRPRPGPGCRPIGGRQRLDCRARRTSTGSGPGGDRGDPGPGPGLAVLSGRQRLTAGPADQHRVRPPGRRPAGDPRSPAGLPSYQERQRLTAGPADQHRAATAATRSPARACRPIGTLQTAGCWPGGPGPPRAGPRCAPCRGPCASSARDIARGAHLRPAAAARVLSAGVTSRAIGHGPSKADHRGPGAGTSIPRSRRVLRRADGHRVVERDDRGQGRGWRSSSAAGRPRRPAVRGRSPRRRCGAAGQDSGRTRGRPRRRPASRSVVVVSTPRDRRSPATLRCPPPNSSAPAR